MASPSKPVVRARAEEEANGRQDETEVDSVLPANPAAPSSASAHDSVGRVITCVVEYVIDPTKIEAFEQFGRRWIELVNRHGGTHHGYFLPAEGASDKALALFSFDSLAAYEQYRTHFGTDPDFMEADRIRDESGCVLRHERTFMRPLLP
jgi:hypothetical protein